MAWVIKEGRFQLSVIVCSFKDHYVISATSNFDSIHEWTSIIAKNMDLYLHRHRNSILRAEASMQSSYLLIRSKWGHPNDISMLIHSQTLRLNSHRKNFQVQYLAQGHIDMQPELGNPSISGQPSLPPGPQPLHIRKIHIKNNISSPKTVQIGSHTSCTLALITGGPQGCILGPHLITLYTNECNPTDGQNFFVKYTVALQQR